MADLTPSASAKPFSPEPAARQNSSPHIPPADGKDLNGLGLNHSTKGACARPPYVPQFSKTTSFILSRMKSNNGSLGSALSAISDSGLQPNKEAFEDARSRLLQSMNSSSTMPLPTTQSSLDSSSLGLLSSSPHSDAKRKRDADADASKVDFSQNTIFFPMPTELPTRLAPSLALTQEPSAVDASASMTHAHSLDDFSKEVWAEDPERRQRIERIRAKRLSELPQGVVPAKPELVGFGAGHASDRARSEYFYSKKKTDLLNVLSLCDQLKPQLLVDLLVSVSKKHPDLPMFDTPDWESQLPSAQRQAPVVIVSKPRPDHKQRHGHVIANQKIKSRQRPPKKAVKLPQAPLFDADAVGIVHQDEGELPPTWHKAGEGLYAKLAPEVEDRAFLVDENDEEAFSGFMVDGSGKQIIDAT
jgi:hypothetical protein